MPAPLVCVITGMEASGTTLCSQLLNGHPRIAAGMECGLLLSQIHDYPEVDPFWRWLLGTNWSWALRREDRDRLPGAASFAEAYAMLNAFKGRAHPVPELRAVFAASDLIYDKTPGYVYDLPAIMAKIDAPFVATFKRPREMAESAAKRASPGASLARPFSRYAEAVRAMAAAKRRDPDRLLIVSYRTLASDHVATMRAVCDFAGLADAPPLSIERYNLRFGRYVASGNSFDPSAVQYAKPSVPLSNGQVRELDALRDALRSDLRFVRNAAI